MWNYSKKYIGQTQRKRRKKEEMLHLLEFYIGCGNAVFTISRF